MSIDSSSLITGNGISLGHAAIRTYIGGPNDQGCYLSFWGGNPRCSCGYLTCYRAHFHTIEDDYQRCYHGIKPKEIHLDVVNIDAVNQKIEEIVKSKGRVWWIQQNCSDLVLEALT